MAVILCEFHQKEDSMTGKVRPVPEGYHAVTPYLALQGAAKAIEFYKQAFKAQEVMRIEAPGEPSVTRRLRSAIRASSWPMSTRT